jgi:DNA mismatch endonuclease, patch repair protein
VAKTDNYPHPTSAAVTAAMKGNKRADTKPELALRSALHRLGLRFRKDHLLCTSQGSKVKVDIAFTRARVAVFVDGCFWHGCSEHGNTPKANTAYWGPKLRRNRDRDERVNRELREDGWKVVRVWEHASVSAGVGEVIAAIGAKTEALR